MRTYQDDERRIHPRVSRSFELHTAPPAGGAQARLLASNLSLGGLYCTSEQDFPEMTCLELTLMLPSPEPRRSAEPLDIPAVVVRRRKVIDGDGVPRFELALLFTALTHNQRERLSRFLAQ